MQWTQCRSCGEFGGRSNMGSKGMIKLSLTLVAKLEWDILTVCVAEAICLLEWVIRMDASCLVFSHLWITIRAERRSILIVMAILTCDPWVSSHAWAASASSLACVSGSPTSTTRVGHSLVIPYLPATGCQERSGSFAKFPLSTVEAPSGSKLRIKSMPATLVWNRKEKFARISSCGWRAITSTSSSLASRSSDVWFFHSMNDIFDNGSGYICYKKKKGWDNSLIWKVL